jgi:hypothetical protein
MYKLNAKKRIILHEIIITLSSEGEIDQSRFLTLLFKWKELSYQNASELSFIENMIEMLVEVHVYGIRGKEFKSNFEILESFESWQAFDNYMLYEDIVRLLIASGLIFEAFKIWKVIQIKSVKLHKSKFLIHNRIRSIRSNIFLGNLELAESLANNLNLAVVQKIPKVKVFLNEVNNFLNLTSLPARNRSFAKTDPWSEFVTDKQILLLGPAPISKILEKNKYKSYLVARPLSPKSLMFDSAEQILNGRVDLPYVDASILDKSRDLFKHYNYTSLNQESKSKLKEDNFRVAKNPNLLFNSGGAYTGLTMIYDLLISPISKLEVFGVSSFLSDQVYRKDYNSQDPEGRFRNHNHFAAHNIFENFSIMKNLSDPRLFFGEEELFIKNLSLEEYAQKMDDLYSPNEK